MQGCESRSIDAASSTSAELVSAKSTSAELVSAKISRVDDADLLAQELHSATEKNNVL